MSKKRPASPSTANPFKLQRKSISLDVKLQVLRRLEAGERQVTIGASLNLATSTIRTIIKNADKIKASVMTISNLSATKLTRTRSSLLDKMESRLSMWLCDQMQCNMPLSQFIIMEKARNIFKELQQEEGDGSEIFLASRGWFHRFKRRSNLHSIRISADTQAAEEFSLTLKALIEQGNYPPQLVFNVSEAGLFWKRMPSRTFIAREEKHESGFKAGKDCLTLLLGGNASGDLKLKPMLVYHYETPGAMKGFSKLHLPVIWKSSKNAMLTVDVFQEWFVSHFCPTVKCYCDENNLEPKALLVLDNAPGYPQNLDTLRTCLSVEVVYLPPKTTLLIQPMDQGVISNFRASYLRRILNQLVDETNGEGLESIRQFWKNYHIMKGIDNISSAWNEISDTCMNGAWKKLWPEECNDFLGFEAAPVISEVVRLCSEVGLKEVNANDVEELLKSHSKRLTDEEWNEFTEQYTQNEAEEPAMSSERILSTEFLSNSITKINEIMDQFTENDPDWERSSQVKRGVIDMISCYRELLRERQLKKRTKP